MPEKLVEDGAPRIDPSDILIELRSHGIFVGINRGTIAAWLRTPRDQLDSGPRNLSDSRLSTILLSL